jgi:hypothetical protein
MKIAKKLIFMAVLAISFVGFSGNALAYNPVLTVNFDGGYGNVRITVSNANPYSQITLYRKQTTTLWTAITNFGQTDGSGYFSASQSLGSDGSNNPVEQYVSVNGVISNTVQTYPNGYVGGCNYNCGTPYGLSLSQSSVSLTAGQSQSVTAYNNSYGSLYISSNSNSAVVSPTISGNQINLYALTSGSSTISVCASYGQCASIYVTVSGGTCSYYNCGGNLILSQTNINLSAGQSSTVTASNFGGSLYVSSNSNSSVVTPSISGSQITLYGLNTGSSTVTVCSGNSSSCGSIYVTVYGGSTYGNITFSQSSITLTSGQSSTINIYSNNAYGFYYISSNSNNNVVSASISGSSLYLSPIASGSSTITVCQYNNNNCGSVYVTVSGYSSGSIYFNPSSLSISSGQTSMVYLSTPYGYSGNYYIYANTSSYIATASISGSTLTITGNNNGTATITVCQSGSSSTCGNFTVTVNGSIYGGGTLSLSQSSVTLTSGQNSNISLYGNGSYYISSGSNTSAFSSTISGNTLSIYGLSSGSGSVTVCQNNPYSCATVYVTVNGYYNPGNNSLYFGTTVLPQFTIGQYYSYQLQAYGGTQPYNYQVISGQLPSGIFLNSQGQLYGTPVNSAYSSFVVRVTDTTGRSTTATFTVNGIGGGVLGANAYANGQLIREGGYTYIVYKNTRSIFKNLTVFRALGYKTSNIITVYDSGLANSGYVINSSAVAHPWGSWIKSGTTIYFVHELGLIPVSSWDVFINNGGDGNNIVPANLYDFQKSVLSVMDYNDSRLR